jgi:hypothetical protein
MHALNHTLEKQILKADGRYLDTQELYPLEQYVQSYTSRLQTYQDLRDNSEKLVIQSLRRMAQTHPEVIQQHGQRCKYDMTEVLRYIALAMLRNDEIFFKEQIVSWLDTILVSYKKTNSCVQAYRYLQEAIAAALPAPNASLTRPYLDLVIHSLQSHV